MSETRAIRITHKAIHTNETRWTDSAGFLHTQGILGRAGIYNFLAGELGIEGDPMASVKMYRPLDVVKKAIAKTKTIVLTDDHPRDFLKLDNVKNSLVGTASALSVDDVGNIISNDLMWTDSEAIRRMDSGDAEELSTGEVLEFTLTSGATESGEEYQSIMTSLDFNHVALVKNGRAGNAKVTNEEAPVAGPEKIEPVADGTPNEVEILKGEVAALKAELEAEKTKIEAAVSNSKIDLEKHFDTVEKARRIIPAFNRAGKSTLDIQREVVASVNSAIVLDGKSDGFVEGAFEALVSNWKAPATVNNTVAEPKNEIFKRVRERNGGL